MNNCENGYQDFKCDKGITGETKKHNRQNNNHKLIVFKKEICIIWLRNIKKFE